MAYAAGVAAAHPSPAQLRDPLRLTSEGLAQFDDHALQHRYVAGQRRRRCAACVALACAALAGLRWSVDAVPTRRGVTCSTGRRMPLSMGSWLTVTMTVLAVVGIEGWETSVLITYQDEHGRILLHKKMPEVKQKCHRHVTQADAGAASGRR